MDAKPTISWYITPITKSYGYNFITYNNITSGTAHPSMNFGNMLKCFWIYFDAGLNPPAAVKLLPKRRGLNIGESYSLEIPENSRLVWWVCHRAPLWVTRGWYSPIGHQGYVDWIIYIYHLVIKHSHGKSPFLIDKPSINGPFSMAMLNNQRVYILFSVSGPLMNLGMIASWMRRK